MRIFTLAQFAKACNATYFGPDELLNTPIQGVVIDSRKVEKDFLFIAIPGEKVDGHTFIPNVYEKGALCCISQRILENPVGPYLLVEDTLQALKDAAAAYRETFNIPVIGITGSVGKTSTKEMISSILEQKYCVLKTPGNFNNEIGLPLTIFMIDNCHEVGVLEMGMNHFGEMHRLSKIAKPTHCVFTNIGVAHLEFLGSRDGIFQAKTEMLDYAHPNAAIFINGDDDKLIQLKDRANSFGLENQNQMYAKDIQELGFDGIRCQICKGELSIDVHIPLSGIHMVYNAMAGAFVGLSLGLTLEQIKAGIEALQPLAGRGRVIHTPSYTLIDDCYNANPISMCASLDILNSSKYRKVAILGDMGELGEEELSLHASVGEHLKDLSIDLVITIGTLSKAIYKAGQQFAPQSQYVHFENKTEFFDAYKNLLKTNDAILIKASHASGFEEIVAFLQKEI